MQLEFKKWCIGFGFLRCSVLKQSLIERKETLWKESWHRLLRGVWACCPHNISIRTNWTMKSRVSKWSERINNAFLYQNCPFVNSGGMKILWSDLWHFPRWSLILLGGVMSHAELLRRCCVTMVWFTPRWLIALLGVHTSGANRSPPSHPWYSRSSLPQSCLYPPLFSLPLRIDWCLVTVLRRRRVETPRLPLEDETNTVKESH